MYIHVVGICISVKYWGEEGLVKYWGAPAPSAPPSDAYVDYPQCSASGEKWKAWLCILLPSLTCTYRVPFCHNIGLM